MTSSVLSSFGVASLLAHLLLISASLVLNGIALSQRRPLLRALFTAAALVLAAFALLLAETWIERGVLLGFATLFSPLLLGLVVIRENQVGVVIKKFSRRNLPAGA